MDGPALQTLRAGLLAVEGFGFYAAVAHLHLADIMTYWLAAPIYVAALAPPVLGERVPVAVWTAEAKVGDSFGSQNFTQTVAVGGKAMHPIGCAGPQIACRISADAVGNACINHGKHAVARQLTVGYIKGADVAGLAAITAHP